jgi:hypothetical protein
MTGTEINSGLQRGLAIDLITSSAVNFPITNANLRLLVVRRGIASIRCTYSTVRLPTRFNFTTNLVFIMGGPFHNDNWGTHGIGFGSSRLYLRLYSFRPSHVGTSIIVRPCWRKKWLILYRRNQAMGPY